MKIFIFLTFLTLLVQVIVSFVSTNQLVTESQAYQINHTKLDYVQKTNQDLHNLFANLQSIASLSAQINTLNLKPIEKELDLTK